MALYQSLSKHYVRPGATRLTPLPVINEPIKITEPARDLELSTCEPLAFCTPCTADSSEAVLRSLALAAQGITTDWCRRSTL